MFYVGIEPGWISCASLVLINVPRQTYMPELSLMLFICLSFNSEFGKC